MRHCCQHLECVNEDHDVKGGVEVSHGVGRVEDHRLTKDTIHLAVCGTQEGYVSCGKLWIADYTQHHTCHATPLSKVTI